MNGDVPWWMYVIGALAVLAGICFMGAIYDHRGRWK